MSHSYSTRVILEPAAQQDLLWLRSSQRVEWNAVLLQSPDRFMETHGSILGCGAQCGDLQSGGLWANKEQSTCKTCLEFLGGSTCDENIHQAEPEPPHLPANGQHICCDIYQQNERHTLKHPIEHGVQPLAMVPSEGHHTVCRAPPGIHNSRC